MSSTLVIVILSLIIFGYFIYRLVNTYFMGPFYYRKLDWFQQNPVKKDDIVFLGDSLTDWGLWSEIFPGYPVKNRGIGGERIRGLYRRLDNVIDGQPAKIFLMIGTNDLPYLMFHNDNFILNYYRLIIAKVHSISPSTQIYITSILPRHRMFARRVRLLNYELTRIADAEELPFLDVYPLLADKNGAIRKDLSNDDLHLMAEGYRLWAGVVRPYLEDNEAFLAKKQIKTTMNSL